MPHDQLTIEQRIDAINEAYTKRAKAREIYATLAAAGDKHARGELRRVDREMERFRREDARLKAERSGPLVGAGSPTSERYRAALDYTRKIEEEFDADLARLGHTDNHTPEVRRVIEETALGYVRDSYGEPAAEHCRLLLEPSGATALVAGFANPVDAPSVPVLPR